MQTRISLRFLSLLSFWAVGATGEIPDKRIDLLSPDSFEEAVNQQSWRWTTGGPLHITGRGSGRLTTQLPYQDYHLVLEYRWGEHTYGERVDRARSTGLILHAAKEDRFTGEDVLLVEGAVGQIGNDNFPPNWKDVRGFRILGSTEKPVGEWNRLEIICQKGTILTRLNGHTVDEQAGESQREAGRIALESRGAECWIRRFELWPIEQFTEVFQPAAVSTNTGASETGESLLPRREPWSPQKSLDAWHIDGDYEMQLVAAEPLVSDPVDVVWDEHGRMFVAEMRDYPVPTASGPFLSRIRLLSDENGDGRMDKALTWADGLDHVQGLVPFHGGLIATTRTATVFLKDTNGDGRADHSEPLFHSDDPRHSQLQVSSGRWGLDNAIHFNNGLDTSEIYLDGDRDAALEVRGWDLRYDPWSREVTRVTGRGQFGASFDDWGRRFFSTNRNPIIFAVMPANTLERNPAAGITQGYEDIQPAASPVYPIRVSHTTAAAHLGTHTAACGLGVYRGHLMPELLGNIFVCEPTGQLVTRSKVFPHGASFRADRVGDRREFLASSDEWTRPVQIRTGPDGGLYICDMYRRFVDHSIFFPELFTETNYMRAGLDHGRIYRLAPKGQSVQIPQVPTSDDSQLVQLLEHPNAWQRSNAQRLLVERKAVNEVPAIRQLLRSSSSPKGRLHALWTLQGLGRMTVDDLDRALADSDPGFLESAIALAEGERHVDALKKIATGNSPRLAYLAALKLGYASEDLYETFLALLRDSEVKDAWIRRAVLSAKKPGSARLIVGLLKDSKSPTSPELLRDLANEAGAKGEWEDVLLVLQAIAQSSKLELGAALAEGLSTGIRRGPLLAKSLSGLLAQPAGPLEDNLSSAAQSFLNSVSERAADRMLPLPQRMALLPLLREQPANIQFDLLTRLVDQKEAPEMQRAACHLLANLNRRQVADFYFEQWNQLGPAALHEALEFLSSREDTAYRLMQRMQAGEINPALMPAFRRWSLTRRKDPKIAALARELFGSLNEDRAEVIYRYRDALQNGKGDAAKGRLVFEEAACVACHRKKNLGTEVGPSLDDIRFKPEEALLTDILDPNRAVEERWATYTIELQNGQSVSGLIAAETSALVEMKFAGGSRQTFPREEISRLSTNGQSLMPPGLESAISETDMVDLIAFLTSQ